MTNDILLFLLILFIAMFLSYWMGKLTIAGTLTGGLIAACVFIGARFTGIAMLGTFFVAGSMATSWKINSKKVIGAAEQNLGKRNAGQVWANGGVAAITGLLSFIFPFHQQLFQLMMAAALASAIADTLSSELGTVYGKSFYNILSFKNDKRGENGVISLEGTTLGIVGSLLIALIYAAGFGWDRRFLWIVVAGTIGNIADSVLGASLERRRYIKNDTVNFLNTLIAALSVLLILTLF